MSETHLESLYVYKPNSVAPVIFTVAFAAAGLVHVWQCSRYKSWIWTFLHPLCCFMFAAGFALREYGAFHYTLTKPNLNVYMASICLIYMAPPLLELANYHVLGRTLSYIPYLSPIHPGRVLTTFGALSSVVEVLNAIGVSYSLNSALPDKYIKLGQALMKASLLIQLVVIGLFAVLATIFYRRCHKAGVLNRRVRGPLDTLSVSMGFILARTIYRTGEYFIISNTTGISDTSVDDLNPLQKEEWYFWVFEAAVMLANSLLWNTRHPGRYLPSNKNIHLDKDGVTEVEGLSCEDQRPLLVTMIDPFGWCIKHRHQTKAESV